MTTPELSIVIRLINTPKQKIREFHVWIQRMHNTTNDHYIYSTCHFQGELRERERGVKAPSDRTKAGVKHIQDPI